MLTDVRAHWAAPWIIAVVRAGVMDGFPNHTFQPRAVVRRLDLAQVVRGSSALIAARRPTLGREVGTPRVPASTICRRRTSRILAAAAAVAAGVMPLADGRVPARRASVTGAEAIEAVGRLEGARRCR